MLQSKRKRRIVKRSDTVGPQAVHHFDFLRLLGKNAKRRKNRRALLELANRAQLRAITECIDNILAKNVPITGAQLKRLSRHKSVLRRVANERLAPHDQKRILIQSGGFLGSIIPIALSALQPLISGLFAKR